MRCVLPILVCVVGCSLKDSTPTETDTDTDTDIEDVSDSATTSEGTDSVDNGDGSYSYVLPAGFDPGAPVVDGPFTWSYAGQASFSYEPVGLREATYVARVEVPHTLSQKLLGTQKLDAEGRLWTLTAVDEAAAAARVEHARQSAVEFDPTLVEEGIEPYDSGSTDELDGVVEPLEIPGQRITWYPESWKTGECTGINPAFTADNHYYQGDDDRDAVIGPLTRRQKTIVEVRVDGYAMCTGTILRSSWVLTAAHCLFDSSYRPVDHTRITVIRRDGAVDHMHTVAARRLGPEYMATEPNPADDFALLEMDVPFSEPFEDMDLSEASDSILEELDPVNLALPTFAPYCEMNLEPDQSHAHLYRNSAGVFGNITSEKINLKFDGGDGHSGSPIFFCPFEDDRVCGAGEKGTVVAVWSGWAPFFTTHVGPKVSHFFDWGVALMDGL